VELTGSERRRLSLTSPPPVVRRSSEVQLAEEEEEAGEGERRGPALTRSSVVAHKREGPSAALAWTPARDASGCWFPLELGHGPCYLWVARSTTFWHDPKHGTT
jgi:hypothetical protein